MRKWLFSHQKSAAEANAAGPSPGVAALLCGVVAVGFASAPVQAQSATESTKPHENVFEVTPFIGYMAGGEFEDPSDQSPRDVEEDTNWGLFLNFNAGGPDRQYELLYSKQGTTIEGAAPIDMDIQYLQIGGIVNFTDVEHVIPYFGLTAGATKFSPDAAGLDDETKLSFTVGGGVKVPITAHVGLRFDARAFVTLLDTDGDIFCVSGAEGAGCRISAKSDTFLQYALGLGVVASF